MQRLRSVLPLTALAFVLAACSDGPTTPVPGPELDHKGNHPATGGSPKFHFVNYAVAAAPGGELSASFKQTGLGSFQDVDYTLRGKVSVTIQCFNKGGKRPQGSPHVIGPVAITATKKFPVKNGQVTGNLELGFEAVEPCKANGHIAVVTDVTWLGTVSDAAGTMLLWGTTQDNSHDDETPDLTFNGTFSAADLN